MRVRRAVSAEAPGSGVAPPTLLVLPPCGMTESPYAAAVFMTRETSSVEAGRTTASASPCLRPLPSRAAAEMSAGSVMSPVSLTAERSTSMIS